MQGTSSPTASPQNAPAPAGRAADIVPHAPPGRPPRPPRRSASMGGCSSIRGTVPSATRSGARCCCASTSASSSPPAVADRELPVVVPTHFLYDGDALLELHLATPNPVWRRPRRAARGPLHRGRRLRLRPGRGEHRPRLGPDGGRADQLLRHGAGSGRRRGGGRPRREGRPADPAAGALRAGRLGAAAGVHLGGGATAGSCPASGDCGSGSATSGPSSSTAGTRRWHTVSTSPGALAARGGPMDDAARRRLLERTAPASS